MLTAVNRGINQIISMEELEHNLRDVALDFFAVSRIDMKIKEWHAVHPNAVNKSVQNKNIFNINQTGAPVD